MISYPSDSNVVAAALNFSSFWYIIVGVVTSGVYCRLLALRRYRAEVLIRVGVPINLLMPGDHLLLVLINYPPPQRVWDGAGGSNAAVELPLWSPAGSASVLEARCQT